jgi:RNA polymerase sigma-70 factor, ECF subfamily
MSVGADTVPIGALHEDLEHHRTALTRHCAHILGSQSDAEDAVQETLLRAWRSYAQFEGRSGFSSWLHRIAANVCFDMLNARSRLAVPVDPESIELTSADVSTELDPANRVLARETLRLALVVAVERLPPRQRAALILREGLCWKTNEIAELLETSDAAVNSALQRARRSLATIASADNVTLVPRTDESPARLLALCLVALGPAP